MTQVNALKNLKQQKNHPKVASLMQMQAITWKQQQLVQKRLQKRQQPVQERLQKQQEPVPEPVPVQQQVPVRARGFQRACCKQPGQQQR